MEMAPEPLGLRRRGVLSCFARPRRCILAAGRSTGRLPPPLHRSRNAPLPDARIRRPERILRFGGRLSPDHSRRDLAGLVSYYALFKGMAASKPTSQLSQQDHILRYT